ncbi:transcriptional repressor [Pseudodesulfovibrio sp. JC047]|uniref:Fur family transcriptional regulator n=1 Tax=Pseudodesulfovibrio sp. JC047 TaxID=2683199 RepID=UPI0013D2EF4D|nr:transcriptional repressor [Pseudodesulfovibrio sp. JC047]NDV18421.1 transcriptional repressor [Pseudodesulfovibrio sp. JC047]
MSKNAEGVFLEYLDANALSMTPQRKRIVETFLETEHHFSAEQLGQLVKQGAPDIGQATVYRTLKLLVESGLAASVDFGDGITLYEHAYGHAHHDHLVCMKCGVKVEIYDASIEARQEEVAIAHGYTLTRHHMCLFGLCAACQAKEK